jgi:alpha-glucosidase
VPRFPTRLADGGAPDPARTKVLLAALLCLRGTPFLYQGDELGLPQAEVPFEKLRDPFAIAAWAGPRSGAFRDGARTPMPWRDVPGGGFSTAAETWLPVDPAHLSLAAESQASDDSSILNFTRAFLRFRKGEPALQAGTVEMVAAPEGVLAFGRELGPRRLMCLFELAGQPARFDLPAGATLLPSPLAGEFYSGTIVLPPFGGAILAAGA